MKPRLSIVAAIVILGAFIILAYQRSGLMKLPSVPEQLTASAAGLHGLDEMKALDEAYRTGGAQAHPNDAFTSAVLAAAEIRKGASEKGIRQLQEAVRRDPSNLFLGNALRMETFRLKRAWINRKADDGEIAWQFPDYLQDEPARFFRALAQAQPIRETKLNLALALVDQMILFPALEIKAPASVESVETLTDILRQDAYYVPALFARGLNYLYRPIDLVWPEKIAAPADGASQDMALCMAIGQKLGVGSRGLKAEMALTLGDAYAKEGKLNLARSWWQIAKNMTTDGAVGPRALERFRWEDDSVRARLEQTLQRQMEDLDHPLSDLRFIWQ